MGVPAYNGGLFRDDPEAPAGRILANAQPTNAGLCEALFHLAVDTGEGEGPQRVDYADLGIRHLGDVYAGLLQFEADRAREDLAYDSSRDAYVPAAEDDEVAVAEGERYLRGRSGGRKASGSHYTPQIVVRHLVNEALVPVLDDHLAEVEKLAEAGEEDEAARLLWRFRVCDPAMGSGHFLGDALDVLTDRIAAFLLRVPAAVARGLRARLDPDAGLHLPMGPSGAGLGALCARSQRPAARVPVRRARGRPRAALGRARAGPDVHLLGLSEGTDFDWLVVEQLSRVVDSVAKRFAFRARVKVHGDWSLRADHPPVSPGTLDDRSHDSSVARLGVPNKSSVCRLRDLSAKITGDYDSALR